MWQQHPGAIPGLGNDHPGLTPCKTGALFPEWTWQLFQRQPTLQDVHDQTERRPCSCPALRGAGWGVLVVVGNSEFSVASSWDNQPHLSLFCILEYVVFGVSLSCALSSLKCR